MAKGRDFFTQIGITKKDRNEMAGCMALMIIIPFWIIIIGTAIGIMINILKFVIFIGLVLGTIILILNLVGKIINKAKEHN